MNSLYVFSFMVWSLIGDQSPERKAYDTQVKAVQRTTEDLRGLDSEEKDILSPYRQRLERQQDESLRVLNILIPTLSTLRVDQITEIRDQVKREIEGKLDRHLQRKPGEIEENTYVSLSDSNQSTFYIPFKGEFAPLAYQPGESMSPTMEKVYGESFWISDQIVIQISMAEVLVAIETTARFRGTRDEYSHEWFSSFKASIYESAPQIRLALEKRFLLANETAAIPNLSISQMNEVKFVSSIDGQRKLKQKLLNIQQTNLEILREIYVTSEATRILRQRRPQK